MDGVDGVDGVDGGGANAKLMPFPDITESAEISPLPRRQEDERSALSVRTSKGEWR